VCQTFSQSVQGLRSSDIPKMAISVVLTTVRTAVLHCDNNNCKSLTNLALFHFSTSQ